MTARTDAHRPSAIIPADYDLVCVRTFGDDVDVYSNNEAVNTFNAHREHTGGVFAPKQGKGDCHVCGARMRDYAIFYHTSSNSYIRTGMDCASHIESGLDDAFRRVAQLRRAAEKRAKGVAAASTYLEELGIMDTCEAIFCDHLGGTVIESEHYYGNEFVESLTYDEAFKLQDRMYTLASMIRNLVKWGSWSEKQDKYAITLAERIQNAKQVIYQRREEKANTPPAPEGKVVVEGVVACVKTVEGYYGYQTKMLVVSDEGWKVWSTVPAAINDVEKGDRISFTATVTRSEDDHTFAFAKRPSKAKILQGLSEEASEEAVEAA